MHRTWAVEIAVVLNFGTYSVADATRTRNNILDKESFANRHQHDAINDDVLNDNSCQIRYHGFCSCHDTCPICHCGRCTAGLDIGGRNGANPVGAESCSYPHSPKQLPRSLPRQIISSLTNRSHPFHRMCTSALFAHFDENTPRLLSAFSVSLHQYQQ